MSLPGTYLGDGVYATFDGWQIWLRVQRGYAVHEVALEPAVYDALLVYARTIDRPEDGSYP